MLDFRHIFARFARLAPVLPLLLCLAVPARASGPDGEGIAALLGSPDPAERSMGLSVLAGRGQDALPGLIRAMTDPSARIRRGAVIGVALQPAPALADDGLLRALRDDDATVRSLAAHTLARIGEPVAGDLAALLGDPDDKVRVAAALALSRMGTGAIPALCSALDSPDPAVTAKAAWLLGALGSDGLPAVPALTRALGTSDMRLVHVLAETIDLIGPAPAMACQELALIGLRTGCPVTRIGGGAAPTLVKLLARPGTPLGHMALYALARMGSEAEPALRAALATGTEGQKAAAALLLTGIDPTLAHSLPEDLRKTLAGTMHIQ
ncbi:HEAT repeat domain-containing protein [Pseudodesulfovibrio indicus]|uniref:HEAT repeat protein n=1 Tax=Pseudodesulfovibrio indicus TaxID=1716143 RepID=A0A126QJY2_9BACT|nr:HEAT repeat domain-containing protein [Pseudodesulfovibrio indicus]AMK10284.1 hypothetical protein AWY79_03700 [Pseudodesulfovibrio indicus]TDT82012.1 HEAT repeat protein [Pseudodesulfovibrio indicus]